MSSLRPIMSFFGSKWRSAKRYPEPLHDHIIEPFAGGAGYSLRYADRKVTLIELDERFHGIWSYVQKAPASEILALPDLESGQSTIDLNVPQEAKWLIGMWLNSGVASPCVTASAWMRPDARGAQYKPASECQFWGAGIRRRLVTQQPAIAHWVLVRGSYECAPEVAATWFVDPPYQMHGRNYRCSEIDYQALGEWCRRREGQVIVCENAGADWLPFRPHISSKSNPGNAARNGRTGPAVSSEVIWP